MRRARTVAAWFLLVGSAIAWPVSHLTFAKDEAPITLALSWFAILLVALDLLTTSQMAEQRGKSDDPQPEPRYPDGATAGTTGCPCCHGHSPQR